MFKINRTKWLAAVAAAEAKKAAIAGYKERCQQAALGAIAWKDVGPCLYREAVEAELTMLYSIRAAARDRVHRVRAALTYAEANAYLPAGSTLRAAEQTFRDHGGTVKLTLDAEVQAKYVGERWKEYERVPAAVTAPVEELLVQPARV